MIRPHCHPEVADSRAQASESQRRISAPRLMNQKGRVARTIVPIFTPEGAPSKLLLNMDHLAIGIQGAMHANFLAFKLLDLVLVIDIVSGVARGILEHILVT
jgi:hypothetical protein